MTGHPQMGMVGVTWPSFIFVSPIMSVKRVRLDILNLVGRLIVADTSVHVRR